MAKTFNGRKYSHGIKAGGVRRQRQCPLCGNIMLRFQGTLRCTEVKKAKTGNNAYRMVKHGSLKTIAKRVAEKAA